MKEKSLSPETNKITDNSVVQMTVPVISGPDVCLYQPFFDYSFPFSSFFLYVNMNTAHFHSTEELNEFWNLQNFQEMEKNVLFSVLSLLPISREKLYLSFPFNNGTNTRKSLESCILIKN